MAEQKSRTLLDVFQTLNEEQTDLVLYLINLIPRGDEEQSEAKQSATLSAEDFLEHQGVIVP